MLNLLISLFIKIKINLRNVAIANVSVRRAVSSSSKMIKQEGRIIAGKKGG